jgi:multiple sugar transport system substrate-binding protein
MTFSLITWLLTQSLVALKEEMMRNQMSRRAFLRAASLSAAGAWLVACQPAAVQPAAGNESAPSAEAVELRLAEGSWVGPEGISFWTDEIIPPFQAENPNVSVVFESAESPDYQDKLYTQAVAGDAPDVFFIWWSSDLMEEGQLLPLNDYFDDEYMADFYPGNIVGQVYEDKLYGVPKYISTVAMGYNKTILDAAGIAYPDGTWDWDDYLEAFRATTTDDGNQWGAYVAHEYLHHWVWMNGGEWMNSDLFGTKCLLNEEKAMQALQFNHDMIYGAEPVSPQPGSIPDMGWYDVFSSGKIAFVESHSWTVTNYIRQNDFEWDFTDLPVGRDGTKAGLTFINNYSIYAGTEHPEEAVQLVKYLTSPESASTMCKSILGLQPARRSLVEVWNTESEGARAGYDVSAFARIMDHARLVPIFQDDEQILTEIFNPIWEQIWVTNEIGLEEGVQLIVDRIDEHFAS